MHMYSRRLCFCDYFGHSGTTALCKSSSIALRKYAYLLTVLL